SLALGAIIALGTGVGCSGADDEIVVDGGSDGGPDSAAPDSGDDASSGDDGGSTPDDDYIVERFTGAPTAETGGATCAVQGSGAERLLDGDVLVPGVVYEQGGDLVDAAGIIQCVGCDCAAQATSATQVICPDAVISPGLINAHDHIGWANASP